MAQELVQGIDLWINTPRRPWEACGTSGMKVLVNGGLNFSELDGWWAEAYSPLVGWAIGDGQEHGDDPARDALEADAMYTLLEREVVPEFYQRDEHGMPTKWLGRIRESMCQLTPEFSVGRTLRDYTQDHYLPAASGYAQRAAKESALGAELLEWQHTIAQQWSTVRFGAVSVDTHDNLHSFRVEVSPGDLPLDALRVELYADPLREGESAVHAMTACEKGAAKGIATYSARVAASRAASDYTPRIVPYHPSVSVPLETSQILWQR
jgi:starch phosphorylase